MEEVVLFGLCFFVVLVFYEIFIVKKAKKKKDKIPMEAKYLIGRYKIDLDKANYNQLLQVIAIVSSFDIALIVSIAMIFDSYLYQILVALIVVVPIILLSYHLVGLFYKKKGLIRK